MNVCLEGRAPGTYTALFFTHGLRVKTKRTGELSCASALRANTPDFVKCVRGTHRARKFVDASQNKLARGLTDRKSENLSKFLCRSLSLLQCACPISLGTLTMHSPLLHQKNHTYGYSGCRKYLRQRQKPHHSTTILTLCIVYLEQLF